MEARENDKPHGDDMRSAVDTGIHAGGEAASSAQEGNQSAQSGQSIGGGNVDLRSGPAPGQTPFPYGYFQSPNLHPGYYMTQGGIPQGPMPGPGYPVAPGYYVVSQPYAQQGPAVQQGTGQSEGISNPGNPGQLQAHDAPGAAGVGNSAGYGLDSNADGRCAAPGHYKEPGHDELRYGTYMDSPGHEAPDQNTEMAGDTSESSGLASFFQLGNDSFWKGILIGSLATLLLTNSTVKKGIMKTMLKASASVKGGIEEIKEQLGDMEAEVLHELNEKKK